MEGGGREEDGRGRKRKRGRQINTGYDEREETGRERRLLFIIYPFFVSEGVVR